MTQSKKTQIFLIPSHKLFQKKFEQKRFASQTKAPQKNSNFPYSIAQPLKKVEQTHGIKPC